MKPAGIPFNLALFLILFAAQAHAAIIDSITFETGDLSETQAAEICKKRKDACGPCPPCDSSNSLIVVSSPVGSGKYAALAYLPACNERSEFRTKVDVRTGDERWYGWSMYIPRGFSTGKHYVIFSQIHHRQYCPCSTPGSDHMVMVSGSHVKYGIRRPTGQVFKTIGSLDQCMGKWTHFVLHIKYESDSTGFDSLWVKTGSKGEYALKVARNKVPTIECDKAVYFFKFGLYFGDPCKGNAPSTTIYMDSYRMGDKQSSFEEVRPDKGPSKVLAPSAGPGK